MTISIDPYVYKSGQLAAFFTLNSGAVVNVTAVGSNPTIFVNGSAVQIQGPYWFGTTKQVPWVVYQLSCGPVQSIMVQNGGTGYSGTPSASASGGGGSGCVLGTPVVIHGVVTSIPVTNGGSGYTSPPTVSASGGGGTGLVIGTPVLSAGVVTSIPVTNGGSGYTSPPAVSASGGGGTGLVIGTPVLNAGLVTSIPVTTPGSGYTSPPTITISGGGGSGAVAVPIMTGARPSDTVTYSALANWLTAGTAGSAAAATSQPVANYAGRREPGVGGYYDFDMPDSAKTMPVGIGITWPHSRSYYAYNACANWIPRVQQPWTNSVAGASTPDGFPTTITGVCSGRFADQGLSGNGVDTRAYPTPTGIWTFVADDINPVNMFTVDMIGNSSAVFTKLGPGGTTALVFDGILTGGVRIGRVWQWRVGRTGALTNWGLQLALTFTQSGTPANYANNLRNMCMFSPFSTQYALPGYPDQANALGADGALLYWMNTTSGRTIYSTRWGDSLMAFAAQSNIVDVDDLRKKTDFSWNQWPDQSLKPTGGRTISITNIRTYAPVNSGFPPTWGVAWSSPNLIINAWNNHTGYPIGGARVNFGGSGYTAATTTATASGGGGSGCTLSCTVAGGVLSAVNVVTAGSGYLTPPTITITDSGGGSGAFVVATATLNPADPGYNDLGGGWYMAELTTDAAHNLKTGQELDWVSGSTSFTVSSGTGGTQAATIGGGKGNTGYPVFVTSPTTFVIQVFWGDPARPGLQLSPATGLPGNKNNVIGTTLVAYKMRLIIPDAGGAPWEVAAQTAGRLSGSNVYINLPTYATDLTYAEIARLMRDNTAPGRQLHLEFGDENWGYSFSKIYVQAMGNLGAWGPQAQASNNAAYAVRSGQIHKIFIDVFNQPDINGRTGRGSEIYRIYGSQFKSGSAGVTTSILAGLNAYNLANPSAPFVCDGLAIAPYLNTPGEQPMLSAIASLGSQYVTSISYLWPTPWSRAMVHDVFRLYVKYNTVNNGPTGFFAAHHAAIAATYNAAAAGQPPGTLPELIGYEGGVESLMPAGVAVGTEPGGYYLRDRLEHDLYYDPCMLESNDSIYQTCQQGGLTFFMQSVLCNILANLGGGSPASALWGNTTWHGQPAGLGDGSGVDTPFFDASGVYQPPGTPVTNLFYADTGQAQHLHNASPKMLSMRKWVNVANPLGNSPLRGMSSSRTLTGPALWYRHG